MASDSFSGPPLSASFSTDPSVVGVGPDGQLAHVEQIAQLERLALRLLEPRPGVWTVIGNGLSNATFVDAPDGLIAIDTGECIEEMAAALAMVRKHTERPVVAVIYTHFHYVAGTRALEAEGPIDDLEIWGHERIALNRTRSAAEIAASFGRGMVHQFGLSLPETGPDSLLSVGTGPFFRNKAHAPHTDGHVAANRTFGVETTATIAGLECVMTPAPSDSDDSITIWFPELGVAIDNLVWPALFNVFAIRGEEYRDPRVLLAGLDHLLSIDGLEHLLGTHGPPLSGADTARTEVTLYRDSIQFLWDQTVRGINRGLTLGELIESIQLPALYQRSYLTTQLYGLAEHHVRQIHAGLVGWFDGYEAELFPLPTAERCRRLIAGFGGRDEVRRQAEAALADDDLRWALELATWLVRSESGPSGRADGGSPDERALLASVLRTIGQRTTSSNVRNWCLTRARELDGSVDLARYRTHRFSATMIRTGDPTAFVHTLRVLLDPECADGIDTEVAFRFDDGRSAGLHVRNSVAVPTDGDGADATVELSVEGFARVMSNAATIGHEIERGAAVVTGDSTALAAVLACFDLPGLQGLDPSPSS